MICIVITFLVVFVSYVVQQFARPKRYPPGPWFTPIVGNYFEIKKWSKTLGGLHLAFDHLAKASNTNVLGLKLGNDLTIVIHSYNLCNQALTSEAFEGRPDNFFIRLRSMGERRGITSQDGEKWSIQRNFVLRHLKTLGLGKQVMSTHIKNEVANFVKILPYSNTHIKDLLAPSVINIFWNLTVGSRIAGNSQKVEKLLELMRDRSKAFDMAGGILNIFPWLRFIAPRKCGYELICKLNKELDGLFKGIIAEHYEKFNKEDKLDDLIYVYLKEIEQGNTAFTEDELVMVLVDLFIGGSQTTSTTLDFAFMMMVLRPDIQEKVQHYLDVSFDTDEEIDYNERHRVPYVEAIINEVLRFFYVAPLLGPRRTLQDTELDGYLIPKGTIAFINIYPLLTDKSYWKDPEVFRPERFLDEKNELISYEYLMSFGLGRRNCLAQALARNCLFTFFSEIVRKFEITLHPDSEEPSLIPQPGMILSPKPYLARFTKRS